MPTERIEIDLVEDDRARSNQLFALEAVDLEDGRTLAELEARRQTKQVA